jgi:hypothetical protein
MRRLSKHLRANVVAYLALFIALGGTSYAAIRLPAGSVGTRQIKNHSITPVKFNASDIKASVRYWAVINGNGRVLEGSNPRPKTFGFGDSGSGVVNWGPIHHRCFPIATVDEIEPGFVSTYLAGEVQVETFDQSGQSAPRTISLALACSS